MREPKNQMFGTMEPPLMQLSVKTLIAITSREYVLTLMNMLLMHTSGSTAIRV